MKLTYQRIDHYRFQLKQMQLKDVYHVSENDIHKIHQFYWNVLHYFKTLKSLFYTFTEIPYELCLRIERCLTNNRNMFHIPIHVALKYLRLTQYLDFIDEINFRVFQIYPSLQLSPEDKKKFIDQYI